MRKQHAGGVLENQTTEQQVCGPPSHKATPQEATLAGSQTLRTPGSIPQP